MNKIILLKNLELFGTVVLAQKGATGAIREKVIVDNVPMFKVYFSCEDMEYYIPCDGEYRLWEYIEYPTQAIKQDVIDEWLSRDFNAEQSENKGGGVTRFLKSGASPQTPPEENTPDLVIKATFEVYLV